MKERPVNMRAEEVRAILAGRKTQFRRSINPQPVMSNRCGIPFFPDGSPVDWRLCPFGKDEDVLWVRECWGASAETNLETGMADILFRADQVTKKVCRWRSSAHMPRWASRITLEVLSVRVQRLQDISEEDAIAEGCSFIPWEGTSIGHYLGGVHPIKGNRKTFPTPMQAFRSLYGPRSWDANPWVWVIEFRRLEVPND